MRHYSKKLDFFYRRAILIGTLKFSAFIILFGRLFKLQILDHIKYRKLSDNNSKRVEYIIPRRGDIVDRAGFSFTNTIKSKKLIYYKSSQNFEAVLHYALTLLGRHKDMNEALSKAVNAIKKNPKIRITLARNLTKKEIAVLEYNSGQLPGIEIISSNMRSYIMKDKGSSLIGFVGKPADSSLSLLQQKMYVDADYKTGLFGIEKKFNAHLEGILGTRIISVDAVGNRIGSKITQEPVVGKDLKTTLDHRLQNYLAELIGESNGCATLMDLQNGHILAMHSTPSIDPNLYARGLESNEWQEMMSKNKTAFFFNKNVALTYPPGSPFKSLTALAAIENGVDWKKPFKCTGEYVIGNRVAHCWNWDKGGHGVITDTVMAIAKSCNCYFYNLIHQLSIDDVHDVALRFGLGRKTNINIDNEKAGIIPNKAWKKARFNQVWVPGDSANAFIGQGYNLVTGIQLLSMISRIATNRTIKPIFIYDEPSAIGSENIADPELISVIQRGLYSVINEDFGIMRYMKLQNPAFAVCGKTGSAQTVSHRIKNEDMRSGRVQESMRSHGLFVGYAPYHAPRFAVSVIIEHGIAGATSGAPIGIKLLHEAQKIL